MKFYLLLSVFGLTTFSAMAQRTSNDYVVTSAGDTLRGRVQVGGKRGSVVYLYRPGLPMAQFTAKEASSYGDAAAPVRVSKMVGPHGNVEFVTPLVQGYMSLYSLENEQGKPRFLLQPADSTHLIEVPPVTPRLTYLRLMPDCPDLDFAYSAMEKRFPYTYSGLSRLVTAYNACKMPQQPNYVVKRPGGIRTSIGIKAGLNSSNFKAYDTRYAAEQSQNKGYQVGALLRLSSKSRFSMQAEVVYMTLGSTYGPVDVFNGYAAYTTSRTVTVQYAQVQIPLLFRYSLGHSNIRPFVNVGPSYGINFQDKSSDSYQDSNKPAPMVRKLSAVGGSSLGLAAGAGVSVQRASLPEINLELRYDNMLDATGFSKTAPTHRSIRFDVGILF